MFTKQEISIAHALAAEKLLEPNNQFITENQAMVPIFINLLLQSIEITLKCLAIESGIATDKEVRDRKKTKNGHGIKELATLIEEKLGGESIVDILLTKQGFAESNYIIKAMIFDPRFSPSRESYAKRNITYSELKQGELQIIEDAKSWAKAVILAAKRIDIACDELKFRVSANKSVNSQP